MDKAIATEDVVVVIVTILLRTIFVNSIQKPVTKSNKLQSSHHVESVSKWHDDCQILIGPFPEAADQSENSDHGGGQILSCQ